MKPFQKNNHFGIGSITMTLDREISLLSLKIYVMCHLWNFLLYTRSQRNIEKACVAPWKVKECKSVQRQKYLSFQFLTILDFCDFKNNSGT